MHARILFLSAENNLSPACTWAQQILTEISAAFGHSFSFLEGRAEAPLSDGAVSACQKCQAVFLADADHPAAQELYDEFDLPLAVRLISLPAALCGRHEAPVRAVLAQVLSLDEDTRRAALRQACALAGEEGLPLAHVPPAGAAKAAWTAEIYAAAQAEALDPREAARRLILSPDSLGLCLCSPYAGGILLAAASALYADRCLVYDSAWDGTAGVYAPALSDAESPIALYSTAAAVAALLRRSLGLSREADCVLATLDNVLAAPGETPQSTLDLLCSQIAVAGALAGFSHPSEGENA